MSDQARPLGFEEAIQIFRDNPDYSDKVKIDLMSRWLVMPKKDTAKWLSEIMGREVEVEPPAVTFFKEKIAASLDDESGDPITFDWALRQAERVAKSGTTKEVFALTRLLTYWSERSEVGDALLDEVDVNALQSRMLAIGTPDEWVSFAQECPEYLGLMSFEPMEKALMSTDRVDLMARFSRIRPDRENRSLETIQNYLVDRWGSLPNSIERSRALSEVLVWSAQQVVDNNNEAVRVDELSALARECPSHLSAKWLADVAFRLGDEDRLAEAREFIAGCDELSHVREILIGQIDHDLDQLHAANDDTLMSDRQKQHEEPHS